MTFICTKDTPWKREMDVAPPIQHPDAREVPSGSDDTATYKCPNCNHEWTVELPQ